MEPLGRKNHCHIIPLTDDEDERFAHSPVGAADAVRSRKIRFDSRVSVIDIPSRCSYSHEERETLWMPPHDLKRLTEKNLLEFAAEGWYWQNAVEEEGMVEMDGCFVHPIHTNPMLKEALQRQIPYPRAVTPPDEDEILRDAQTTTTDATDDPVERPSSPFVETVFDPEYSSEEDDMLIEDPDAYLMRRFAHHRKPRDDIPYGDSDDAYYTQILCPTGQVRAG